MRIGIIYGTKRGSTKQIVEWIQDQLLKNDNVSCTVFSIDDEPELDFDLYIIGCPIYFERPLKSMRMYVERNIKDIKKQPVAVFILGWAKAVYSRVEKHIEKNYFGPLISELGEQLLSRHMFKGWIRKMDSTQCEEAAEWAQQVYTLYLNQISNSGNSSYR